MRLAPAQITETVAPSRLGRSFRWLLASSVISNFGDGIALAAGPLLIASLTRDPLLVSLAVLAQQLPGLLFGLPAGAIADRFDRRRIVVGVDLARAAVLAVLAAFRVLRRTTPTAASTVTFIVPVFALTWASIVLAEPVGVGLLAGFGLVLVSLALVLGIVPAFRLRAMWPRDATGGRGSGPIRRTPCGVSGQPDRHPMRGMRAGAETLDNLVGRRYGGICPCPFHIAE